MQTAFLDGVDSCCGPAHLLCAVYSRLEACDVRHEQATALV
jgi:hypothetical protein